MNSKKPLIAVVGPCKSGKSTLVRGLVEKGYNARQVSQEHSFAASMWRQITQPDLMIYLHCSYETTLARGLNWTRAEYEEQQPRLVQARQHADFEIATDELSASEVLTRALSFLTQTK